MTQVTRIGSFLAFALLASTAMAQDQVEPVQNTDQTNSQVNTGSVDQAQNRNMMMLPPTADEVPPLAQDQLYQGWRAEALLDQEVYGANGNDLGEVDDLIVNSDGQITAIVVEGGGFLEIGDAKFRIPWDQVQMRAGEDEGVVVPLTEERAEDFGLYDSGDWVAVGPREFRISELIGDRAVLRNGFSYGYINDAVFDKGGKLVSVLVNGTARRPYGMYAYPWYGYGYGWDPGMAYYALPVTDINAANGQAQVELGRFNKNFRGAPG